MGFCSGTQIFDDVADEILDQRWLLEENKRWLLTVLMKSLYNHDWDCESDSRHYKHPIVQSVLRELNPDWYDDYEPEDEDGE